MSKIIIILFALLVMACESNNADVVPNKYDHDFFRKTTSEQIVQFSKHSLEVQYELLVVGNQIVHPPAMYLIPEFAKHGEAAIPFLFEKLTQAKEEASIRDIVAILAEMRRLKLYSETENSDLKKLIDNRVAAMSGQWKEATEEMLADINGK